MPYMTEVLWKNLHPDAGLLMGEEWPEDQHLAYTEASDDIYWLIQVISAVRSVRVEMNIPPATHLNLSFYDAGPVTHKRIRTHEDLLIRLARLDHIKAFTEPLTSKDATGATQVVIGESTLLIPLAGAIDVSAEKERLNKELKKEISEIEAIEKKLSNQEFISRAPQNIVDIQQKRLDTARMAVQKLEQALGRLHQ
jgi:valyl-tRNA synthetase